MKTSPLAPSSFPDLPIIEGVQFYTGETGIKYKGRDDVMLAKLDSGTVIAGVFTKSATRSDAVRDCQAKIGRPSDEGAVIFVNAGNANAFTGRAGVESVNAICAALSEKCSVQRSRVFTSSTGVIGEPLAHNEIVDHLDALLGSGAGDAKAAAGAILTTDTFIKGAGRQVSVNGKTVSISGIAKGSGMIAPDMATMLVYIFTDAEISQSALQAMLTRNNMTTFNAITVDGDTSTSDTVLCAATGRSGVGVDNSAEFEDALGAVMLDLAHQVVRDGEGATKFISVNVTGAESEPDAHRVAMSIANSPLVKTAAAGEDANWGRVVMAVGKSGAKADRDLLTIRFGNLVLAEKGQLAEGYREEDGAAYMSSDEIEIHVDLGLGDARAQVWTCDLTHGYIEINADYRS